MEATKVKKVSITHPFRGDQGNLVTLVNQGLKLTTEFRTYECGIVIFQGYDPSTLKPEQIFRIFAGCFEKGSNFEKALQDKYLIDGYERITGIVISIQNIPVLITKYSDLDEICEKWHSQSAKTDE